MSMTRIGTVTSLAAILILGATALPMRGELEMFRGTDAYPCHQMSFGPLAELGPQPSPDGKLVAFEYFYRSRPNLPQIWVMDVSKGFESARPLVDNANYNAEFSWSPDGERISYISHSSSGSPVTSQIYVVGVRDGSVRQITDFPEGKALGDSTSWPKNDLIAFEDQDDIYGITPTGGIPVKLVAVKSKIPSLNPSEIRWSPDSSRLAFTGKQQLSNTEISTIWIANIRTGRLRRVTSSRADSTPSWLDKDHILFSRGISESESRICVVALHSRSVSCITAGSLDLSPSASSHTGDVYVARGNRPSTEQYTDAFFGGFHICRFRLPRQITSYF